MTKYQAGGPRRTYEITLLVVAVAAAGLNLRAAITSLPPLFPDLQTRLHLSSATLSLLAATPVICFGVVSAFAAWLNRRYGEEMILLVALVLLTAGLLLRGAAPGVMLFPGTALAASAIAVLNVLLSSMVKRRWPERAGLLIGIYLTALSVGAILSSLLSVPLYRSSGGSVRLALGLWAVPAALAALLWLPQLRYRTAGTDPSAGTDPAAGLAPAADGVTAPAPARPGIKVYRYALAWQVTAFMGLQSLLYYAALSWLPTIFRDRGDSAVTAGNLLALMGVGNLATSLIVPVLAHRRPGRIAVGAAGHGAAVGPGPRRQPGLLPRPGHLLHDGAGAQRGRRRLAVRLRAVGRLPGRQRRPAGGGAAAHRHRQLEHTGRPAARALCRRTRHGCPGRTSAGAARGPGQPAVPDTRVGDQAGAMSYLGPDLVHSVRLAFPIRPAQHMRSTP